MRSQDDDALGVMVRYQDPNNYYRFSWDKQRTYRRLVKVENGLFTLLAEEAVAYVTGQTYQIEIQASGAALEVRVDGALLFGGPVTDSTTPLTTGSVALYSWANNGSHFDDVEVSTVGPPQVLTVTLAGSGTGTVTSDVAGITCPGDCTEGYTGSESVTLTPVPAAGSNFTGWSGDCTGTSPCVVTMTQARNVTATFEVAPPQVLTVTLAGSGTGTVTSDVAGITCPGDCTEGYTGGESVTLTPVPAIGSTFSGWSGDCTGTSPCVVTMTQARNVTATFEVTPPQTLTVTLTGSGTGTVTSDVAGIACPGDCMELYDAATVVTLTATPAAGSSFIGWSDDDCTSPRAHPCVSSRCRNRRAQCHRERYV